MGKSMLLVQIWFHANPSPVLNPPRPCFSGLLAEEVDEETWPEDGSTEIVAGVELERPRGEVSMPLGLPALTWSLFHNPPHLALALCLPTIVLLLENSLRDLMEGGKQSVQGLPHTLGLPGCGLVLSLCLTSVLWSSLLPLPVIGLPSFSFLATES